MKNTISLRENHEFRRTYYKGKSFVCPLFIMYVRQNGRKINRLGITAGKKVGIAVLRNRSRRIIKEAYRLAEDEIKTGNDIVMVARTKTPFSNTAEISASLKKACAALKIQK